MQRNIEKEEAHRLLAEDEGARASVLRRAKEAVLAKLSCEYRKTPSPPPRPHAAPPSPVAPYRVSGNPMPHPLFGPLLEVPEAGVLVETSAAAAAVTREILVPGGCGAGAGAGMGMGMGTWCREGLFGRNVSVLSDRGALESQTALVPLMFSRG